MVEQLVSYPLGVGLPVRKELGEVLSVINLRTPSLMVVMRTSSKRTSVKCGNPQHLRQLGSMVMVPNHVSLLMNGVNVVKLKVSDLDAFTKLKDTEVAEVMVAIASHTDLIKVVVEENVHVL